MADDIVFKVSIGEQGKSLNDLRKEFKDLQTEVSNATKGTEAYYQSLQKLANVKDEIEDLREEITGLQGAGKFQAFGNVANSIAGGFQSATAAAALFGVQSEEVEKTLLKVQAAMALTQGIKSLEGLGQAFAVVGTVIKTQVITALTTLKGALIATGIGAAVVALGALVYAANQYNETLQEEIDKQGKLNEELKKTTALYDEAASARERKRNAQRGGVNDLEREIKVLEASGAKAEEIYNKRVELIDKEIFNLKVRRNTVEGNADLELKYSDQIKTKETERIVLQAQNEKRLADERKKLLEDRKKLESDYYAQYEKDDEERLNRELAAIEANRLQNKEIFDKEAEEDFNRYLLSEEKRLAREVEVKKYEDKLRADELQAEKDLQAAKLALQNATFEAVKGLSDLYFSDQLAKAKGNADEEVKIRKKQFEVDKAFSISRAVIDGLRSVNAALTIPPPAGPILAAANAILAAATVAKISATRFDSGASSAPSSLPSTSSASAPQTSSPVIGTPVRQDQTNLDANGYNLSAQKVIVTERDITKTQNRVNKIKVQSSF